eukprot:7383492-Prymnesium_polylepis.1
MGGCRVRSLKPQPAFVCGIIRIARRPPPVAHAVAAKRHAHATAQPPLECSVEKRGFCVKRIRTRSHSQLAEVSPSLGARGALAPRCGLGARSGARSAPAK